MSVTAAKNAARKAYMSGKKKLDGGNMPGALKDFREADRLYPGAAPKHKIAVCLDRMGRVQEAIAAYRAFINSNPPPKYAERVASAGARITALEAATPATVIVAVVPANAPGLQITVDNVPQPGPQLQILAGQHTIGVSAQGYQPYSEVISVRGGQRLDMPIELIPVGPAGPAGPPPPGWPPPPPPDEDKKSSGHNIPAYVCWGLGGVGLILGTIFGVQAVSAQSSYNETPNQDDFDKQERSALIADISFGSAIAFGVAGTVLYFVLDTDEEPADQQPIGRPSVTPYAGPNGGGLGVSWAF